MFQNVLEVDLKAVSESTEIGETVQRMEYLIAEFSALEKACNVNIFIADIVMLSLPANTNYIKLLLMFSVTWINVTR